MNIDDGWRSVNSREVAQLLHFYDRDVNTQSASSILLNCTLSGGVWVEAPGGLDDEPELSAQEAQVEDNMVWSQWSKELYRYMWAVGFAAGIARTDQDGRLVPGVLQLEQLMIEIRRTYDGECEFRYFDHSAPVLQSQQPLKNVITFVMRAPDHNLNLCSVVSGLIIDYQYEMHMVQCTLIAEKARAQPMMVVETVPVPYTNNSMPASMRQGEHRLGDGRQPYAEGTPAVSATSLEQQNAIRNDALLRYINGNQDYHQTSAISTTSLDQQNAIKNEAWLRYINGNRDYSQHLNPLEKTQEDPTLGSATVPVEVKLRPQLKLSRHVLAETPANLIPFRAERQVRVFMAFGVPMSMAHSVRSKANTAQSSMGSSSTDNSSKDVFLNTQKALKQSLLSYIKKMYHFMHHNTNLLKVLRKSRQNKETVDPDQVKKRLMPRITIASLPDETVADRLYAMGALTYSALVSIYSQKYGIDKNDFNANAQLPMTSIEHEIAERQLEQDLTIAKLKPKPAKPTAKKTAKK